MSGGSAFRRVALLAYPRRFRQEYGTEVLRAYDDLRTHGGLRGTRVAGLVLLDVARTAPRMRLESLMQNHQILAVGLVATVVVVAALVGSVQLLLLAGVVIAAVAVLLRRGEQPLATEPRGVERWWVWLLAGAACFAVGGAVLVVDGPELTSAGWTVWMLSWACALVLVVLGLVLVSTRLLHRTH